MLKKQLKKKLKPYVNFILILLIISYKLLSCTSSKGDGKEGEVLDDSKSYKEENRAEGSRPVEDYKINYYSKRRWCPLKNSYNYMNSLDGRLETKLKNYYKIYSIGGQVLKEESYKDINTGHGSWFYYNIDGALAKEILHKGGVLEEEYIYEYDKSGYKKEESHYVYREGKKRLRLKSLYYYNRLGSGKAELGKIENYNAGILDEYIKFEYDKKGRVRKKSTFLYKSHLKSYILYKYRADNTLELEETYNRQNEIVERIEYKVKSVLSKKALSKKVFRRNLKNKLKLTTKINYSYNKSGLKVSEVGLSNRGGKLRKDYNIVYSYDESNCKESEKRYNGENELIESLLY